MNKSDREFLGSVLQTVSDAIYSGNTDALDHVIQNLRETPSVKYPDAPDGATHVDLNDVSESKWIKVSDNGMFYYNSFVSDGWDALDSPVYDMELEEL